MVRIKIVDAEVGETIPSDEIDRPQKGQSADPVHVMVFKILDVVSITGETVLVSDADVDNRKIEHQFQAKGESLVRIQIDIRNAPVELRTKSKIEVDTDRMHTGHRKHHQNKYDRNHQFQSHQDLLIQQKNTTRPDHIDSYRRVESSGQKLYDDGVMRRLRFALVLVLLLGGVGFLGGEPSQRIEFHYQGMKISVTPSPGGHISLSPIMKLLGGDISYSEAAGVWAMSFDDHLIQMAAGRKLLLVDGKLMETPDPPVGITGGLAVTFKTLNQFVLAPFSLHAEKIPEGWIIRPGASFGEPVIVYPMVADFGSTTTLALALEHQAEVVIEDTGTGTVLVHFPRNTPRLDTSRHFESRNIVSIQTGPGQIEVKLADDIGVLNSNVLHNPERVVMELGTVHKVPQKETRPPVVIPSRRTRPLIVIDPGHGGSDTGALGEGGIVEKNLTLAVSRFLSRELNKLGYGVRMTREKDEKKALTDRASLANRLDATLFVSLHANSSTVHSVRGAETYYVSLDDTASDAAAKNTAEQENSVAEQSDRNTSGLDLILWDMAQSEVLNESAKLALDIQLRLNALLGIKDRGVKQAPFVVLTGATMPAALVEIGFLSNPKEAVLLEQEPHQQELARAIALGVHDFLEAR